MTSRHPRPALPGGPVSTSSAPALRASRPARGLLAAACLLLAAPLSAQVRIVANGDSITAGSGASQQANRYTDRLDALLGPAFSVQTEGVSGATLLRRGRPSYRSTNGVASTLGADPDIITIMLGTNDSKASQWSNGIATEFVDDYVALIDTYRAGLGDVAIHPVLPPPATDADVRGSVVANEIIPGILEAARRRNLTVIDANSPFGEDPLDLFTDGVHPNDAGHLLLAETFRDALISGRVLRPLPEPWQRFDIGATGRTGADALGSDGSVLVFGAGNGGSGSGARSDSFRFVAQTTAGDASLVTRVAELRLADPLFDPPAGAAAGVMIRESLVRDSRYAAVFVTAGQGVAFRWRSSRGSPSGQTVVAGVAPPVWLRLVREGDQYTGQYSTDGSSWIQIGTTRTLPLGEAAHAGLAVNSGNTIRLARARFELSQVIRQGAGRPAAPNGARAEASAGTVTLNWLGSQEASAHRIWRSGTADGNFSERGLVNEGSTFTDGSAAQGATYYYAIVPENENGPGPASSLVRVGPPEAPTGLAVEMIAANQARLSWNARDDADFYRVKRSVGAGPYVTIATIQDGTTHVDPSVLPGTRHRYVVTAVNGSGESPASAVAESEGFGLNRRPSGTRPSGGLRAWPVDANREFMSRD